MKRTSYKTLLISLLILLTNNVGAENYKPVIKKFDGQLSLNFPATPALELGETGTIEFWVSANWSGSPPFDPCILSYTGGLGARYSIHITADRQAIGLHAGNSWEAVDFDFSDNKLHYVAFVTYGGLTDVYIDGALRGEIGHGYSNAVGTGFYIGSLHGVTASFKGAIAGLRIWELALDESTLYAYAKKDVLSKTKPLHPELDFLVGVSSFSKGQSGFTLIK